MTTIERALAHGSEGYTLDDVLSEIRSGKARVFFDPQATMIVETDPWEGSVHIWLAGGRLKAVLKLFERVELWARAQGYRKLTIEGRAGWKRYAPRYDLTVSGSLLEKAL